MGKWEKKEIGECLREIQTGKTPPKNQKRYYENSTVDWFSPSDFDDDVKELSNSKNKISKLAVNEGKAKIYPLNSLLLVGIGATIGKVGLLRNKATSNQQITALKFKDDLNVDFVYYWFKYIKDYIVNIASSATMPIINQKEIKKLPINYPKSLPEQQRIVAKLDGLFKKIDKAIGLLEENIQHTQALMGSVLDEEFRRLNCKSHLLKKISDKIQYGYTGKTKENGKYYYLRITDIQDGKVDFSKAPFSDISQDEAKKYILNQGDILFARTGATAGKSYLFNDKEPSVFASYLIRVVVNQEILSSSYLKWYFQSDEYWNQIFGNIVGAAQPNFNGKKLGELNIPVPDLETQNKCVFKFEQYNKVIKSSVETQTKKLTHLKFLKSSLLDQAFKGEL